MMKRGKAFLKLDPSFLKGISKWYKTGLDGMVQFLIIFQHIICCILHVFAILKLASYKDKNLKKTILGTYTGFSVKALYPEDKISKFQNFLFFGNFYSKFSGIPITLISLFLRFSHIAKKSRQKLPLDNIIAIKQ